MDVKKYWSRRPQLSRPALTTFSCEAVGGEPELSYDVGVMFTLASAGFGIHDDILDKSFHKHLGRSTILGLHGIDSALLVGDLLIFKAWTIFHKIIRKMIKSIKIADIIEAYGNSSIEICEAEFNETLCRKNLELDLNFTKNTL
ncbi:MAG: polyprenyl synthetase family protein, partial [Candidatus Bathyarchaeota archaeon]|nr:polyprenyl synthetase family protein [Candidatus Bathyarchaeota archaeon]